MSKGQVNKTALVFVVLWSAVLVALFVFSHTVTWCAMLLEGIELLFLFWSVLSPLYVLLRMGFFYLESRHAARLGMTLGEYQAQKQAKRGGSVAASGTQPVAHGETLARWGRRLLRIAPWELAVASGLLVLFGVLAHHDRGRPYAVSTLGLIFALVLYALLGLQLLHRVWAHWHHRLAPGSAIAPEPAPEGKLPRAQMLWDTVFTLCLLFAAVELFLSGASEATAVILVLVVPALGAGMVAAVWHMVQPRLHRRHTPAV